MRLDFFSSGLFWGIFFVILGFSMILKVFFKIELPIVKIGFALFLIYAGVSILFGGFKVHSFKKHTIFGDSSIKVEKLIKEHNTIFGKSIIDFSEYKLTDAKNQKVELNTVFGNSTIILNQNLPVKMKISSTFAGAKMPDGNVISFGDYTYKTKSFKEDKNFILIEANVVFGGLQIKIIKVSK